MAPCLTEETVAALVGGDLDSGSFATAERHLSSCARCMRLVEAVGGALTHDTKGADAAQGPLARGTRVGRYEILESVGTGGMGRVYAARDPALDRKVALKLLHPTTATADLEARLLREAKAMARLSQPEVITVHDVGQYGDQLFIAMEFVEGGTLRQWLAARPRTLEEILTVFLQAARGLAASHDVGLVHRDFKPDNVLVRADGRVLVSDFGLVRDVESGPADGDARPGQRVFVAGGVAPAFVDVHSRTVEAPSSPPALPVTTPVTPARSDLTLEGTLLGTPAYMAPEQITRATVDGRSDVYSFCVALYEAIYGVRPFRGATLDALLAAMKGDLRFRKRAPPVPGWLVNALRTGLQLEPEQRPATMRQMLALLQPPPSRGRSRARALSGAAGLVVLGALAAGWVRRTPAAPAQPRSKAEAPAPPLVLDAKSFRRATFDEGCEEFPSFTPDGASLAFDGTADGRGAIFLQRLADHSRRQLTHPVHATDLAPAVSPAGDRVAFVRQDGESRGTYVVDIDGNEPPRAVCDGPVHPSWSRDGSAIFCGRRERIEKRSTRDGSLLATLTSPPGAGASETAELATGELAVNFAHIGEVTAAGLGVFGVGGELRWLTHESSNQVLAITPGGRHVLGVRALVGEDELVAAAVDGSGVTSLLTSGATPHKGLAVRPDGRAIAYSNCDGGAVLADVDAHGALTSPQPANVQWQDEDVAALGDTDRLLVASSRGGGEDFEAWVVDRSGATPSRKLDVGGQFVYYVAASPDARTAALVTEHESILVAPIDGSSPARRLTTGARDLYPAFLGRDLLFTRVDDAGQSRILRVPLEGGEERPMFDAGTREPATSPDGRSVVYLASAGADADVPRIYDVRTGRSAPLSATLGAGTYASPRFSLDGRKVALVQGRHAIVEVDLATHRSRLVAESGDLLLRLAYTHRGIVAARVQWTGDIFLADVAPPAP